MYRVVQIFGGGKLWRIWYITGDLPDFTLQFLTMSHVAKS